MPHPVHENIDKLSISLVLGNNLVGVLLTHCTIWKDSKGNWTRAPDGYNRLPPKAITFPSCIHVSFQTWLSIFQSHSISSRIRTGCVTCSGVLNGGIQKQLYYDIDLHIKRPYRSNFSCRRHEEAHGAVQPHLNATLAIPTPAECIICLRPIRQLGRAEVVLVQTWHILNKGWLSYANTFWHSFWEGNR